MRRLFLCDDTDAYRALLRVVLDAEEDLEVVGEARNGPECIAAVPGAHPDVVLLDLDMPGMDGFEALPRLREVAPDAEVVILTTANPGEAEDRARELGAAGFVEKPRNVFDLPGRVREAVPSLDRRRLPRAC